MRVLVTGAAGFIGSNLTSALLSKGWEVRGLDNFSWGKRWHMESFAAHPRFAFAEGDVRDAGTLAELSRDCDAIVHLAAFKIPRYGDALETLVVNGNGTKNVLEAARANGCRVVTASTSDTYGRNPGVPFAETSEMWMGPSSVKRWAYAISKMYDEHLAFGYQEKYGVPITILRFFGGYGPNQNLQWWGGPQAVFIGAALKGEEMEIHGDGRQTRSFTHVSDHVDGIVRCLERPEVSGNAFNLGAVEEISILDLARLVWRLARDDEPKYKFVSYSSFGKYEDVRRRVPDIAKARKLLGFEPQVRLEAGLRETVAWQREAMQRNAS